MRIARVLIPSLALALVLAACGSDSSETKSASTTTTAAASSTTAAAASGATVKAGQTKLGSVLVNAEGRTLYHLDGETATHITCTGNCANKWPPVLIPAGQTPTAGAGVSGNLVAATRPDGTKQAAFDDKPLYLFSGDSAPGDTNGEGVGGVWHVVKVGAVSGGASSSVSVAPATTAAGAGSAATTRPTSMGGY